MKTARLCCCLITALAGNVCWAATEFVPEINLAVEADDNPRLGRYETVAEDRGTVTRMLFDARFTSSAFNERGDFRIEPRIRADAYSDSANEELESEDLFLNMRGEYRWPRTRAGFQSYISRESIRNAELLEAEPIEPDIDDPIAGDTGQLILLDEHRTRAILQPSLNVRLSERSNLLLDARYMDVSYSGPELPSRSGFNDLTFSPGIERNIDDRNRAAARLIVSNFEADANENQTDTVGVEGTFSRVLSDIWTFNLSTGLQRSEFSYVDEQIVDGVIVGETIVDGVDTDFTLALGFRKRSELGTLNLAIRRLVQPNASGFLQRRTEFQVSLRRQMSPRVTGGFALRAFNADAFGVDRPTTDRDYARLGLDLEWALTPVWFLRFGYDAIYQEFQVQADDATANRFSIGVRYRGLSRRDAAPAVQSQGRDSTLTR